MREITRKLIDTLAIRSFASRVTTLKHVHPLIDAIENNDIRAVWDAHSYDFVFLDKEEIYEKMVTFLLKKMHYLSDKKRREEIHCYLILLVSLASEEVDLIWQKNTK